MPVIIWHLLAEPAARYTDLGSDCYGACIYPNGVSATTSASFKPSATRSPAAGPAAPTSPGSANAPPGAAARPLTV